MSFFPQPSRFPKSCPLNQDVSLVLLIDQSWKGPGRDVYSYFLLEILYQGCRTSRESTEYGVRRRLLRRLLPVYCLPTIPYIHHMEHEKDEQHGGFHVVLLAPRGSLLGVIFPQSPFYSKPKPIPATILPYLPRQYSVIHVGFRLPLTGSRVWRAHWDIMTRASRFSLSSAP